MLSPRWSDIILDSFSYLNLWSHHLYASVYEIQPLFKHAISCIYGFQSHPHWMKLNAPLPCVFCPLSKSLSLDKIQHPLPCHCQPAHPWTQCPWSRSKVNLSKILMKCPFHSILHAKIRSHSDEPTGQNVQNTWPKHFDTWWKDGLYISLSYV